MPTALSYRGVCYRLFIALHKWHRKEKSMAINELSQDLLVVDGHPEHGPWDNILPTLTLPEDRRVIRLWYLLDQTERERNKWRDKLEAVKGQRDAALALLEMPLPPLGYWISCRVCHRGCARRADDGPMPEKAGYGHADGCPVPGILAEVQQL